MKRYAGPHGQMHESTGGQWVRWKDIEAEVGRLRAGEWDYGSLSRILQDELPLTMTLGLTEVLVTRMVTERMFAERVDGVIATVAGIAKKAAEAAGEE